MKDTNKNNMAQKTAKIEKDPRGRKEITNGDRLQSVTVGIKERIIKEQGGKKAMQLAIRVWSETLEPKRKKK